MKLPQNLYSRLSLITSVTLIVGYLIVHAATTYYTDLPSVNSGSGLTATSWNNLVNYANKAVKQDTETLTVTGGKVGIGTTSPVFNLDIDNTLRIKKTSGNSRIDIRGGSDGGNSSSIYMYNPSNQLNTVLTDGTYNSFFNVYGGNVGIGTASPGAKLDIYDASSSLLFVTRAGAGSISIVHDGGQPRMFGPPGLSFSLGVAGDAVGAAITMKPGGNVGINNSNPSYALDVGGYIRGTNLAVSDERFKKNITHIISALDKIEKLEGVTFDWRKDEFKSRNFPEGKQIGFIAQQVEKILPEIVVTDNEGYKGVEYSNITAVLVEAVKELKKENDSLRQENKDIKSLLCLDHPTAEICK